MDDVLGRIVIDLVSVAVEYLVVPAALAVGSYFLDKITNACQANLPPTESSPAKKP